METKIPTHDEIRATFASVRDLIERNHLCLNATRMSLSQLKTRAVPHRIVAQRSVGFQSVASGLHFPKLHAR
jgi:hypothetical protein